MGRVILARPGYTDFDEQERMIGTLDIPLSVRGEAEIADLAAELQPHSIDRIFAAEGAAAKQSAAILGDRLGIKVKILEKLHNVDLGLWQGLPIAEVKRKHPRLFKQWEEEPAQICPPAGETADEAIERVRGELKPVVKKARSETVVLFAPDPLRCIVRCQLKGTNCPRIWGNGNGAIWESIEV